MKFNNINKCLIIFSTIFITNINTCFSTENQGDIVKFGSYVFSEKDGFSVIDKKPDTNIKIENNNNENKNKNDNFVLNLENCVVSDDDDSNEDDFSDVGQKSHENNINEEQNKNKNDGSIVKFGSYIISNEDDYVDISKKPDTNIKIEDIIIEEKHIGQVNVKNKTNKIPSRNLFQNETVLNNNISNNNKENNNKILVNNPNTIADLNLSQTFKSGVKFPNKVYKKTIVKRKSNTLNIKTIKKVKNNYTYNENNLKADISDLESSIFYEQNYICSEVVQNFDVNQDNNQNIINLLNYNINFIYNTLETNLNKNIEEIIYVLNNHKNTSKFPYYKY